MGTRWWNPVLATAAGILVVSLSTSAAVGGDADGSSAPRARRARQKSKHKHVGSPAAPPEDRRDAQIQTLTRQVEELTHSQHALLQQLDEVRSTIKGQTQESKETAQTLEEAKSSLPTQKDSSGKGRELNYGARWKDGPVFETANKDYFLHVGGEVQQDWVFFRQDNQLKLAPNVGLGPIDDGVFFRRARLKVDGSAFGNVEWDFDIDFRDSVDVVYDDLWVGLKNVPYVGNIRVGHVKVPQGLESVTSNRYFTFAERATIFDAFTQEYDPGILLFRTATNQRAVGALCLHRLENNADGFSIGNGEYALTGRVNGLPIWKKDGRELLHLGASYSHRPSVFNRAAGQNFVRFRARPEVREQLVFPRFIDTGNFPASSFSVSGLEAAYVHGPVSAQAEYMRTDVNNAVFPAARGTLQQDVDFDGFYAYVSWFLTGEFRPYDRRLGRFGMLKPKRNFTFDHEVTGKRKAGSDTGWGAFELAVRYSTTDLNSAGIRAGALEDWTYALNWYFNPNLKLQLNVVVADRDVTPPALDGRVTSTVARTTWAF